MTSTKSLFWLMFLVTIVNTNPIVASTIPASTETNTVNTIDVLQNQLNQILVQLCASEIDRNKTASAALKFGQLADAKSSMKNVVEFYIENYEESFDNLLIFIDHISSFELQHIGYKTLVEAIKLKQINVMNLLSFENFIRTKSLTKVELVDDDNIEQKIYEDLLSTVGTHIKELIIATDINKLVASIKNSSSTNRIFNWIPTIVQCIDLNNFTDMDRIFELSVQLPIVFQIKLVDEVLCEMQNKAQYRHVFHVIVQIRSLRKLVSQSAMKDLLSELESEIPSQLKPLISEESKWRLTHNHEFLSSSNLPKYSNNILLIGSDTKYSWSFFSERDKYYAAIRNDYGEYLSVEYCFHNESFPTAKPFELSDLTQINWYLLVDGNSDDFAVQIKNIYTNEFLVVDNIKEINGNGVSRTRVALSAKCSDSSKWWLVLE